MLDNVGTESRGSWLAGCALAGGLALGLPLACAGGGWWWWHRVPKEAPPSTYGYAIPADQRTVGGIDLDHVHRDLWVAWVLAREPGARVQATDAVVAALAADPALAALAGTLGAQADARALSDEVDLWNAAMTSRGAPWALGAGLDVSPPYVKAYYVVARPTVAYGDRETRLQVGVRADRLAVVEGWLGLADDVGEAVVVVDRVADFAFDTLWPMLADDATGPSTAALRAAAAADLPPDALEVLVRTAPARAAMVAALFGVEDRRDRCGSRFVVRFSWDGLEDLAALYAWADRDRAEMCPGITYGEADAIARGTMTLRRDDALPAALEALVAWGARHVVVHEGRHQIDHEDWGAGTPPPSETCPVDGRARIEASAYLSALGSGDAVVAWVQGCEVVREGGGLARAALTAIARGIGASCDDPPPGDLADKARALAKDWFGRDEPAPVIRDLPRSLPFVLAAETGR